MVICLCIAGPAMAQQIPGLVDLPAAAAGSNPGLAARRAALLQERAALHEKIDSMNSRCGTVEEGSAAEKACDVDQAALTNSLNAHIQQSNDFNAAAQAAILAAKNRIVTSLNDTSVVDARNVPSGLPKSVDDAIVSGYSGAPPGVSDRVRKGFQAIAGRDWKVARAWFQDALNHDPDNVGLKRLVDLADYTEKYSEQKVTPTSDAANKPDTSEEIPADADPRTYALTSKTIHTAEAWKRFIDKKYPKMNPSELPKDSDIDFLFPGLPALEAKELSDYTEKYWISATTADPN